MSSRCGDPFAELISPRQLLLNRLADTAQLPPSRLSAGTRAAPLPTSMFEAGEQLQLFVDLSGADAASVGVETKPRLVTVTATFPPPPELPPLTFTYRAGCCGTTVLRVELPAEVVPESAQVQLEDGRLRVVLRKAPARRVPVQDASV